MVPVPPLAKIRDPPLMVNAVVVTTDVLVPIFRFPIPKTATLTIPVPSTVIVLSFATVIVEVVAALERVKVPELTVTFPFAFIVLV